MTRVLVDTSVWIRHFRRADTHLQALLAGDRVLCHPLVLLEIACGTPPAPRARTLEDLANLDRAPEATLEEILGLINRKRLHDTGCGAVDMCLLASTLLADGTKLWTDDWALRVQAERLGVGYAIPVRRKGSLAVLAGLAPLDEDFPDVDVGLPPQDDIAL